MIGIRKFVPRKFSPRKFARQKFAPRKFAPGNLPPKKIAPRKFAPRRFAPRILHNRKQQSLLESMYYVLCIMKSFLRKIVNIFVVLKVS